MVWLNNNFDENTMNNIKNLVDKGDINGAISQISPEMIQSFSKMMANSQGGNGSSNNNFSGNNSSDSNNGNSGYNSDFGNIDMNAVMKMASTFNSANRNDPRSNLLNALKPYMRDSKKGKIDNYMNILNMAKMADLFKNSSNSMNNSNNKEKS